MKSKITKHEQLQQQADKLSTLTFLLARACEQKEAYFTKKYNLTNAEFRCLRLLNDNTTLNVKDLAEKMNLSPSRITQIITGLEEKKFIDRKIDLKDRRNIVISVTKLAQPLIEDAKIKHIELHEKVLKNIPESSRENVLEAIEELLKSLYSWSSTNEKK